MNNPHRRYGPLWRWALAGSGLLLLGASPGGAQVAASGPTARGLQSTSTIRGSVLDAGSGDPLADVVLRLADTEVSAVSDASGAFVMRGIPTGEHTLEVRRGEEWEHALRIGVHRTGETFEVILHVSPEGISMEILDANPGEPRLPGSVEMRETEILVPPMDPTRYAGTVVERVRLQQLSGGARNLGELLARAVPGLNVKEQERTVDGGMCLEFGASGPISLNVAPSGCRHPQIYLDGVIVSDPSMVYGITALEGLEWVQAIPANEASGEFGGAVYGVVLVATTGSRGALFPRGRRPATTSRSTFDWDLDPDGHPFFRTFLAAAAGTVMGLAAGVEVGRECIFVEERTQELDSSCSSAGTAGVSLVAVALPALGSALGARFGGSTAVSRGQFVPALMGAGLAIVPGYIYSLVTVGNGVDASNAVGKAFLLVGTPLLTALADRLYRNLR